MKRRRRIQRALPELPSRRELRRLTRAMTPRSRFERVVKSVAGAAALGLTLILARRVQRQHCATYSDGTT
jgi:ferric-dicitrate binding protein FerR (iron transport regulator)